MDLVEFGPENSRRARGLKVWASLLAYGADGYRDMIERNIRIATHLKQVVEETEDLVLSAPRVSRSSAGGSNRRRSGVRSSKHSSTG